MRVDAFGIWHSDIVLPTTPMLRLILRPFTLSTAVSNSVAVRSLSSNVMEGGTTRREDGGLAAYDDDDVDLF